MKTLATLVGLLVAFCSLGQGALNLKIRVVDTKLKPKVHAQVIFTNDATGTKLFRRTSSAGRVEIKLDKPGEWWISIDNIRREWKVNVPEFGEGTGGKTITYNYKRWKRENRPVVDRSKLAIVVDNQSIGAKDVPTKESAILTLKLNRQEGKPALKDFPVDLTCYKLQKTFRAKTDSKGVARFRLPIKNDYQIDIDGVENFEFYDIGAAPAFYTGSFTYEPTDIVETSLNDTITQDLKGIEKGTSGRSYFKLKVNKRGAGYIKDEPVYLKMLKSNKVYRAKTNKDGEAEFLLPIHRKYLIDFKFEKDVDLIDLSRVKGLATGGMERLYQPDPRLEHPERYLPKPNQVFIAAFEEFVDKQFPEPTDNFLQFYAKWSNPEVNANSKEAMMELGFSTKSAKNAFLGPPINVAFVIDKSGSMGGYDRIEQLKLSMVKFIKQLRPQDIVSLIVFDGSSRVLVPAKKLGDKKIMTEYIMDIQAGGGTYIYSGLEQGFKEVKKNYNAERTNRVVLLTDGFGSETVENMVAMAKKYTDQGIEVSCVGVGGGYNQALLTQLATVGGGLMHYAGDAKKVDQAFTKEMTSILSPIGKNAKIEVTYNGKLLYSQMYGHDPSSVHTGKMTMDLKQLYAGLNKLALIRFDLNEPTKAIEKQAVKIKMTFHDYALDKDIVQEQSIRLKWSDKAGKIQFLADKNHKKLYAMAIMNQTIKVMAEAYHGGDNVKGKQVLITCIGQVKNLFPEASDADVKKLVGELNGYVAAFDQLMANARLNSH